MIDENEADRREAEIVSQNTILLHGKRFEKLPPDLYIPPDALEVILDAFTGPLDLLLYLIRKQNLDILDIPIVEITVQYVEYVEMMKDFKLELAADYLVMAAILAEIKSRMLLPRQNKDIAEEVDPRAELVKRLQEYERFKQAAENFNELPKAGEDFIPLEALPMSDVPIAVPTPQIELKELVGAFLEVLKRSEILATHKIQKELLSVREKMGIILDTLRNKGIITFCAIFSPDEGKMGVIVTFLAMLELVKESLIDIVQAEPFGVIHLKALDYEPTKE